MGIRQPGMQREEWDLDGEGDKESQEEPEGSWREAGDLSVLDQRSGR